MLKCSFKICNNENSCKISNAQCDNDNNNDELQHKSVNFRLINPSNDNNKKNNKNIHSLNMDSRSLEGINSNQDSIELKIKSNTMPILIKTIIIIVIAIIFGLIVSAISIFIYRWCMHDQIMMHHLAAHQLHQHSDSICQHSDSCKYEINSRALEESFFHSRGGGGDPTINNTNHNSSGAAMKQTTVEGGGRW
jgi:hypothetical protein